MLEVNLDRFQTAAYDLAKPGRVCTFGFGRGTGKTYLGRFLIHDKALSLPGIHVGLLMPSLKQARAVFWPGLMADFHHLRGHLAGAPNKTELTANYANGSRLTTWGAENAQSIRGQRFDVLIEDEADDIDHAVESQVVEPTFSRSGTRSIWVKFGTPRRGRYGTLYRDFRRALDRVEGADGKRKYFGFRVTSEQSPQVDQTWLAGVRKKLLEEAPTVYAREYLCDFDAADGLVYSMFVESFHAARQAPRGPWDEILVGCDHGWEDPGVFIVIGVQGHGRDAVCWVLEEVYEKHKEESWWIAKARDLKQKYARWPMRWYGDPSMPGKWRAIANGASVRFLDTINDREDGVAAVVDKLAVREFESGGAVQRHARLYVDPRCKNFIWEMANYRRKRDPKDSERFLDVIQDGNDHAMDSTRYAIVSRFGRPVATRIDSGGGWSS